MLFIFELFEDLIEGGMEWEIYCNKEINNNNKIPHVNLFEKKMAA